MKKTIATLGIAGTLVFGAVGIDLSTASLVTTLDTPVTLNDKIKFGDFPLHTVDIKDNGQIDIKVEGKVYAMTPKSADKETKDLFLDFENSEKSSKIKDVWGKGSNIEVKNTAHSVSKIVSFDETFLKNLPVDQKYVNVSFDLGGDWNVPNGTYTNRFEIEKNIWLEKSQAWDSSFIDDDTNENRIDIELEIKDGVLTKKIPVEWLKNATYPIYTDAVFTFGTKQLADAGPIGTVDAMKIGTDKYATCWSDNADASAEGQCIVGTVSGTVSTFGSVSDFSTDITTVGNNNDMGACAAGDDRWVVVFSDDADADDGTARVASSTGTTINGYGTAFDFNDGVATYSPVCSYISSDKIIVAYSDVISLDVEARSCTINSDYTLTCGTEVTIAAFASTFPLDLSCATLDTDKFVCHYRDGNINQGSSLRAGTVSGTTITLGTAQNITSVNAGGIGTDTLGHSLISPATDQLVTYWQESARTPPRQNLVLGTVSGTTITLGATSTPIIATTTSFATIVSVDSDSAFLMYQQGVTDAATTFLAAIPIELNFGALTFSTSSAETIDTTRDPGSLHAAKIGDCKFVFVWEDDNDTNDLFSIIGDTVGCAAGFFQDIFWFD